MPGRDIVVIGASAGGVEALSRLVATLPPGFPAAVFIVLHVPGHTPSMLPDILGRAGPLPAAHARDGEPIRPGRICVAPPDFHLLLRPGHVHLARGPRENHSRPAIDPLFRSAARSYRNRVVGVVLTGYLNDGTAGLMAVRNAGGVAIVQDPRDALVDAMPRTALAMAGADHVLPLAEIGSTLTTLVNEFPPQGDDPMPEPEERTAEHVLRDMKAQAAGSRTGELAVMTCPECGGSLWQMDDEQLVRFRCHIGHAYYGETLLAEQSEALEAALWTAVRIFKEKGVLARQLAGRAAGSETDVAERFAEQAELAERYSELIQEYVLSGAAGGLGAGRMIEAPVPSPRSTELAG